jgi:hypothetical protein
MSEIIGTLIKMGIALFLVAIVVVLGAKGFKSSELAAEQQRLATIVSNIKTLYANSSNYDGLTTDVAIQAGIFPKDMVSGTSVYNKWKGAVTVTGSGNTFSVTYAGVPKDACINLLSNFKDGSLVGITVNGNALSTVPPTPAQAAAACNQDTNTIEWSFH